MLFIQRQGSLFLDYQDTELDITLKRSLWHQHQTNIFQIKRKVRSIPSVIGRISWQEARCWWPGLFTNIPDTLHHPDSRARSVQPLKLDLQLPSFLRRFQTNKVFLSVTILQTPEPRHLVTWNAPNVNFWIFDISRVLTVFMCDFYDFGSNRLSGASGAGN